MYSLYLSKETQITNVTEGRHTVCVNLPDHLFPLVIEYIILRQVTLGLRVDHTVKKTT